MPLQGHWTAVRQEGNEARSTKGGGRPPQDRARITFESSVASEEARLMLKSQFLRLFEEMIESKPGTLTGAEELRQVRGWDSLAAVQFIALVDEHFQFTLDASQLDSCRTINELIDLCGDRIKQ